MWRCCMLWTGVGAMRMSMDGDKACASACGLVASEIECMSSLAFGNTCSNLYTNGNLISRELVDPRTWRPLSVFEAFDRVSIPRQMCPLLCHGSEGCRGCPIDGICPNVFWEKSDSLYGHRKHTVSNRIGGHDSQVLCNYPSLERASIEHKIGYLDPCPEMCALYHPRDSCILMRRVKGICLHMEWNSMVVINNGGVEDVTVHQAYEFLRVKTSCQQLCNETHECVESECSTDNRTCSNLFYKPEKYMSTNKPTACFGQGCGTAHVLCQLEGDAFGAVLGRYARRIKSSQGTHIPFILAILFVLIHA